MLTQGGFLVARARPQAGSVVGRGLLVNAALVCNVNPPFPDQLASEIEAVERVARRRDRTGEGRLSRRQIAPLRACHPNLRCLRPGAGELRHHRPVSDRRREGATDRRSGQAATQPGCGTVADAVEMASALANTAPSPPASRNNMMSYALAETATTVTNNSCATRNVTDKPLPATGPSPRWSARSRFHRLLPFAPQEVRSELVSDRPPLVLPRLRGRRRRPQDAAAHDGGQRAGATPRRAS